MNLLQSIKNFFAPHQPKQEPIVFVTSEPLPVVQVETVLTIQPEPVEVVKVSPAKDWPAVTTAPMREEVKASAAGAWPFPVAPKAEKTPAKKAKSKKVPTPVIKATPAKKTVVRTSSKKK